MSQPPDANPNPKRLAIIAAATTCFTQRGYAQTPIAAVASTAGVGKGTVYEYFRSKEELLLEACLHLCAVNEQQMNTLATGVQVVDAEGHPNQFPQSDLHPVRACFEVLHAVLTVLLNQSEAEQRLLGELEMVCRNQPELLAQSRERFGAKLQEWTESAFRLGQAGMAAGYFHPMADEDYRWCARIIVAAVDGLIWQRWCMPDEDVAATCHHIAAAWLRLHLKHPERLEEYLQS